MNVLADPATGSILGIVGIVATIAIGVTIFLMQERADRRINKLTEDLHEIVHHEDERKESIKKYYFRRIKADFDRIDENYETLKERIQRYLGNKSEETGNILRRFSNDFFPPRVDSFITITEDIKSIVPFLDNPRLIDKYSLIAFHGGQLKGYSKQLGEYYQSYDNAEIIDILDEMDSIMNYIHEFKDLLMDEVDNKLD